MQMAGFVLNLQEVLECGLAQHALAEAATSYHDQSKIFYTCHVVLKEKDDRSLVAMPKTSWLH